RGVAASVRRHQRTNPLPDQRGHAHSGRWPEERRGPVGQRRHGPQCGVRYAGRRVCPGVRATVLESPPTPVPVPTPRATPAVAMPDTENEITRRDACLLVTEDEIGKAMRQGVVANESDIAGGAGGQGCEF